MFENSYCLPNAIMSTKKLVNLEIPQYVCRLYIYYFQRRNIELTYCIYGIFFEIRNFSFD